VSHVSVCKNKSASIQAGTTVTSAIPPYLTSIRITLSALAQGFWQAGGQAGRLVGRQALFLFIFLKTDCHFFLVPLPILSQIRPVISEEIADQVWTDRQTDGQTYSIGCVLCYTFGCVLQVGHFFISLPQILAFGSNLDKLICIKTRELFHRGL
jgi:hypothetical protein